MKKLLAILGSLTITIGGSISVVACSNKDKEKDDTGSVFIDNNGEIKFDSEALMKWYQEHMGMGNNVQQLKEFFQLFAVGVMKEANKGEDSSFKDIVPAADNYQYANENLQKTISDKWSEVQDSAKRAFTREEDNRKRSDGEKNWKKNWTNELAREFPYVDKDYEILKKAWINNEILTNKSNSAEAGLSTIFAENYSRSAQYIKDNANTLTTYFVNEWSKAGTINNLGKKISEFVNDPATDKKEPKYTNLLNLINATGGKNVPTEGLPKAWKLNEIEWVTNEDTISDELIESLLYRLDTDYSQDKNNDNEPITRKKFAGSTNVSSHLNYVRTNGTRLRPGDTYFNLVQEYPNADFDQLTTSGDSIFGFLTNSQRFLVDQYFQIQKPISVSEVVFKPTADANLNENITGTNFLKVGSDIQRGTWTQFFGLYDFLSNYVVENQNVSGITDHIKGTSQYNFDTIFTNDGKDTGIKLNNYDIDNNSWDSSFYEAKNNDKLLTLNSSDYSNIAKYSIYDFVQSPTANQTLYQLNTTEFPNADKDDIVGKLTSRNFDFNTANDIATSILGAPKTNDLQKRALEGLSATLNLIDALNRKVETENDEYGTSDDQGKNKVYQVLNAQQGIIAFVDTDGLHIAKINGYDILKNLDKTQGQKTNTLKDNQNGYINESIAFNRLRKYATGEGTNEGVDSQGSYRYIYQDYTNAINSTDSNPPTDKERFSEQLISRAELDKIKNYGVSYNDLNQAISNDYEKFLINNSILNANSGSNHENNPPFYKFNLLADAQSAIQKTDDDKTLSANNSWLWDYMINLLIPADDANPNETLLNKFFSFEDNDTSKFMKEWYLNKISVNTQHTQIAGINAFTSGWDKWNSEIDQLKKESENDNLNLPLMKLAYGKLNAEGNDSERFKHMTDLFEMSEFEPYWNNESFKHFTYWIDSNNYFLINSKGGKN